MKKFTFSLETARALREQRLEAELAEMGNLQRELEGVHKRQKDLEEEVSDAVRLFREAATHDAGQLAEMDRFRHATGKRRLRLAAEARAMAMRMADQQKVLTECRRDLELLNRLKEKAKARWQTEYDREEQNLADEIFLSRWNRRSAESRPAAGEEAVGD